MKNILPKIFLSGAFSLMSLMSFAQFNSHYYNPTNQKIPRIKLLQRFDFGGHVQFHKAFLENNLYNFNNTSGDAVEYSEISTFRLKNMGFGGNIGFYIPVGYIARKTSLGLNIEGHYTMATYTTKDFTVNNIPAEKQVEIEASYISVPIGLDVRWGGQTTLHREDWASASIGGGISPTFISSDPSSNVEQWEQLMVRPYVKAEFGFITGFFWKVKAMIQFKELDIMNTYSQEGDKSAGIYGYNKVGAYTKRATYSLGLSFNLGSFAWTKRF